MEFRKPYITTAGEREAKIALVDDTSTRRTKGFAERGEGLSGWAVLGRMAGWTGFGMSR
jgi:hypothetical protein